MTETFVGFFILFFIVCGIQFVFVLFNINEKKYKTKKQVWIELFPLLPPLWNFIKYLRKTVRDYSSIP